MGWQVWYVVTLATKLYVAKIHVTRPMMTLIHTLIFFSIDIGNAGGRGRERGFWLGVRLFSIEESFCGGLGR